MYTHTHTHTPREHNISRRRTHTRTRNQDGTRTATESRGQTFRVERNLFSFFFFSGCQRRRSLKTWLLPPLQLLDDVFTLAPQDRNRLRSLFVRCADVVCSKMKGKIEKKGESRSPPTPTCASAQEQRGNKQQTQKKREREEKPREISADADVCIGNGLKTLCASPKTERI